MTLESTLPARLRLIRFVASNIKRIRLVAFSPRAGVVRISGANGAGKSTALDTIEYVLRGKRAIPSQPIREGESEGYGFLDFGDISMRREFLRDARTEEEKERDLPPYEGSRLTVLSRKGAEFKSPQEMLNRMWSQLACDPIKFQEMMTPKEQLEVLRGVVQLDLDIDALELEIERDFDTRTGVGREKRELEARVAALFVDPEWPREPVDVSALLSRMTVAAEHNRELEKQVAYRRADLAKADEYERAATERRERARLMRQEADELDKVAVEFDVTASRARQTHEALPPLDAPRDVDAIRLEVVEANEVNERVRLRNEHAKLEAQFEAKEAEETALTSRIEAHRALKLRTIAKAKFPVEGLAFGKGEIIYQGVPFDQASKSEQLRVSMAIVMAQHPQVGLVLIRTGSLLDDESQRIVEEMADAHDVTVLMEVVDTSGEVGIYLEEGEIVAIAPGVADALLP